MGDDEGMMSARLIGRLRTTHGACGVETREGAHARAAHTVVAIVGEYELREGGEDGGRGATRAGGASVVGARFRSVDDDDEEEEEEVVGERCDDGVVFERLGGIACASAVFEVKWSPRGGEADDRAVVADAAGGVSLIRVADDAREEDGAPTARVEHIVRVAELGGDGLGMVTCVDWATAAAKRGEDAFAASASDGSFRLLRARDGGVDVVQTFERAHDLEMWAVAFDRMRDDVVYTGADDCALKTWDARDATRASATNRKTHGAGVTCVAPSPHDEHIIATGSYDDHVRVWDCRRIATPLSECRVGGGAWRARWHRSRRALACAAMGGGAVLVDAANGVLTRAYTYGEHESIVYGADWVRAPASEASDEDVLITCSFYDNDVRCWRTQRQQ